MRKRTFDADNLREIGTGLQIDPLNWSPDPMEYLNLAHNIVSTFAFIYHISLRFVLFHLSLCVTQFLLFVLVRIIIASSLSFIFILFIFIPIIM